MAKVSTVWSSFHTWFCRWQKTKQETRMMQTGPGNPSWALLFPACQCGHAETANSAWAIFGSDEILLFWILQCCACAKQNFCKLCWDWFCGLVVERYLRWPAIRFWEVFLMCWKECFGLFADLTRWWCLNNMDCPVVFCLLSYFLLLFLFHCLPHDDFIEVSAHFSFFSFTSLLHYLKKLLLVW